ncbi:hypothetical protein D3C87_1855380 [compost metagenome]
MAGNERQERPDGTGEGEEDCSTGEHDMQRTAGTGVSKAGTECTEETFCKCIIGVLCPRPPDESGDDNDIARNVRTIGDTCPEGGKQETTGSRADRPGDIDAE